MMEREWAKIWGMVKVSLWVIQLCCSMDEKLESYFMKPRKVSLRNVIRFQMVSKLFGIHEAGTENSG